MLMDMEAAQDAETIAKLKKEKHDLKFEIRQLRERVDKLEQADIAHRRYAETINKVILTHVATIGALTDLVKGLAIDVSDLKAYVNDKVNELEDKDGYFDDCISNISHLQMKLHKRLKILLKEDDSENITNKIIDSSNVDNSNP